MTFVEEIMDFVSTYRIGDVFNERSVFRAIDRDICHFVEYCDGKYESYVVTSLLVGLHANKSETSINRWLYMSPHATEAQRIALENMS